MLKFRKYGTTTTRYIDCSYTITEAINEDKTITIEIEQPKSEDYDITISDIFTVSSLGVDFIVGKPSIAKSSDNNSKLTINGVSSFIWNNQKNYKFGVLPQNGADGKLVKYTLKQLVDFIFTGTSYSPRYDVTNASRTMTLNGDFGDDSRWDLLTTAVNLFNKQFVANASIIDISDKSADNTRVNAVFGYNVSEISKDITSNDIVTKRRGRGAYIDANDESKGRVTATYISPLAATFGELEGDIIDDISLTQAQLESELASSVDTSISFSYELTYEQLIRQSISLIDVDVSRNVRMEETETKINTTSKIVKRVITYDNDDNITSVKLTLGKLSVKDQYNKAQSSVVKNAIKRSGGGTAARVNTSGLNGGTGNGSNANQADIDELKRKVASLENLVDQILADLDDYATRAWVLQQIEINIKAAIGPIGNAIQRWFSGGN